MGGGGGSNLEGAKRPMENFQGKMDDDTRANELRGHSTTVASTKITSDKLV